MKERLNWVVGTTFSCEVSSNDLNLKPLPSVYQQLSQPSEKSVPFIQARKQTAEFLDIPIISDNAKLKGT